MGTDTFDSGSKSFKNLSGDFDVTNDGGVFDNTSFRSKEAGGHEFKDRVFVA